MAKIHKELILEDIKIEKVGFGGVGISTLSDGKKIIISGGVIPGSIVDCKVLKKRKDYLEAQILKVKAVSSDYSFNENLCPHYMFIENPDGSIDHTKGCGGCKWQIIPYDKQIQIKEQIVKDSFRNIKDVVEKVGFSSFLHSPKVFNYRNKIEFSFGKYMQLQKKDYSNPTAQRDFLINKQWNLGFNKQGDFSKVVDVNNCMLVSEKVNGLYEYLKKVFIDSFLPVYDKKNHDGVFRHLVIREGFNTDQILVNLVVSDDNINSQGFTNNRKSLIDNIMADKYLKDNITSFVITYNNGLADIVRGTDIKSDILWGEGTIFEKLRFESFGNVESSFRISPFSFFQTNTYGAQVLFGKAAEILGHTKGVILDLYCGAGAIGICFNKMGIGDEIIGIEIVQDAIYDAKFNAQINGLSDKTYFVAGKAEELVLSDNKIKSSMDKIEAIIVDPPRDGLHKSVVNFLIDMKKIKNYKLLYISCNPVTMSRDIELLLQGGFDLRLLQPVDMFPNTHHMEMIGLMN